MSANKKKRSDVASMEHMVFLNSNFQSFLGCLAVLAEAFCSLARVHGMCHTGLGSVRGSLYLHETDKEMGSLSG
jgi:hypothetical protein